MPRAESTAVQRIVGGQPHREFRGIGPPDDDRTGVLEIAHYRRVAGGNGVLEDRQSVGRGFTFHIDVGLDRNRHPEERAGFGPVGERLVGGPGLVHGPFGMIVDDRVQRAVAFGDPRRDRSHNGFA